MTWGKGVFTEEWSECCQGHLNHLENLGRLLGRGVMKDPYWLNFVFTNYGYVPVLPRGRL